MTSRQTTMDPPVTLELPPEDPAPPTNCARCARLVQERADARADGDLSRVSDMNVTIRAHHPPRRKQRR